MRKKSSATHTTITLPIALKDRLDDLATRAGYRIGAGALSERNQYIAWMLDQDEKRIQREEARAAKRVEVES